MIRGSCFCGGIAFEFEKIMFMQHCHCSRCRKKSGGRHLGRWPSRGPNIFGS